MIELVYLDTRKDYEEAWKTLEKDFSFLEVSDASDDIHRYRIKVEGPISRDMFARWAIREGLFLNCLGFHVMIYNERPQVNKWLEQVKKINDRTHTENMA